MEVNDILIFSRVAQAGSFSKAAASLKMPVSTVSRRVAVLEEELGVPLLIRTTRSLKLTDVGKSYVEHGQAIALELEKAQALAVNLTSIPQGTLKITATTDFGNRFLGQIVHEFLRANPQVKADVVLTDRVVDLIGEGFDLGIRMGELDDSSLVARKLGSLEMQVYASPAYLKKKGEPKTCQNLSEFDCILFTGEHDPETWQLRSAKGKLDVKVKGRVMSNDMALIKEFAISGEGLALMPHFMCTEDVREGRLKVILKDWANSSGPIHAVYPAQRFLLPRVRAFMDHLARKCGEVQWRYQEKKS